MKKLMFSVSIFLFFISFSAKAQTIIADHNAVEEFDLIPNEYIVAAKDMINLYYGHTSHGRQIMDGISTLNGLDSLYEYHLNDAEISGSLPILETSPDAGYYPTWYDDTVNRLNNSSSNSNAVMWAWCGQLSTGGDEIINNYFTGMTDLEDDYPDVTFIYMTGHLDTTGSTGALHRHNEQIREHVKDDSAPVRRVLFDFADIERYDPDGNDYLDRGAGAIEGDGCRYDEGNWCLDWCDANLDSDLCEPVADCAHSFTLNCNLKARAFWWMMARLAGWDGTGRDESGDDDSGDDTSSAGKSGVSGGCGLVGTSSEPLAGKVFFLCAIFCIFLNYLHKKKTHS